MVGVDDGIWSGHLDAADVLFLIAAILFVIEAVIVTMAQRPRYVGALSQVALACVAFGLLLL